MIRREQYPFQFNVLEIARSKSLSKDCIFILLVFVPILLAPGTVNRRTQLIGRRTTEIMFWWIGNVIQLMVFSLIGYTGYQYL